jgi:hypothetical protein
LVKFIESGIGKVIAKVSKKVILSYRLSSQHRLDYMTSPLKPVNALALTSIGFLIVFSSVLAGQEKEIPRDTSFTLSNTAPKVYKQYPHAKLVEARLPDDVAAEENIVYARYGKRELHLDLFSPRNRTNALYPGVILIHGGAGVPATVRWNGRWLST